MKKSIIIMSILANAILGFSQELENLKIQYTAQFNPRFDRGRKDIFYSAQLIISKGKSRFFMVPTEDYQGADENDFRFIADTSMQIYVDSSHNKIYSMEHSLNGKTFYVSDSLYPMQWNLYDDSISIGNMVCRKASCDFRGRKYIAWYTEGIPISYGPWKMGGLPGLILDLQDEENNLIIKMQDITYSEEEIKIPFDIKYTYKEYVDSIRKFMENLKAGGRASSSGYCMTCQNQSTYELITWEKMFW